MTAQTATLTQTLSRALERRARDRWDNVSVAVEGALLACAAGKRTEAVLRSTLASLGDLFLTSLAALLHERGRLTQSLFLADGGRARGRWVRAVLSLMTTATPLSAATDSGVECAFTPSTPPCRLCLRARLVSLPPYVPQPVTPDDAFDPYAARIVACEMAFLDDMAAVLRQLCALVEADDAGPHTAQEQSNDLSPVVRLHVPVYTAVVVTPDTAATRLASVTPFSNAFLLTCTTCRSSHASLLLHHTTHAVRTLWWLVSGPERVTPRRLAALDAYVHALRAVCDEDAATALQRVTRLRAALCAAMAPQDGDVAGDAPRFVPASVLVHCMRGVSRSPSIVLLFLVDALQTPLRQLWQEQRECAAQKTEDGATLSFLTLLDALRAARPAVGPNLVFVAEMRATWRRVIESLR